MSKRGFTECESLKKVVELTVYHDEGHGSQTDATPANCACTETADLMELCTVQVQI